MARDRNGFVLTGRDIPMSRWVDGLPPANLATTVPGVFAAGDIRAGSMKRVAAATGEGASVVPSSTPTSPDQLFSSGPAGCRHDPQDQDAGEGFVAVLGIALGQKSRQRSGSIRGSVGLKLQLGSDPPEL